MLKLHTTPITGLVILEPQVFIDERGFFMESYSKKECESLGISCEFIQDNHSCSNRGVLRGLHFQTEHTQAKLVRVTRGSVYDVAVDLRSTSPTFGQWYGVVLSATNKLQFFVPQGFAHGFLTLEDGTEFQYKCSDIYDRSSEGGIRFDDHELAINWSDYIQRDECIFSEKDLHHPTFREFSENNPF